MGVGVGVGVGGLGGGKVATGGLLGVGLPVGILGLLAQDAKISEETAITVKRTDGEKKIILTHVCGDLSLSNNSKIRWGDVMIHPKKYKQTKP